MTFRETFAALFPWRGNPPSEPLEAFEARLDANLAARRAARPMRSQAASKGWQTRKAKA